LPIKKIGGCKHGGGSAALSACFMEMLLRLVGEIRCFRFWLLAGARSFSVELSLTLSLSDECARYVRNKLSPFGGYHSKESLDALHRAKGMALHGLFLLFIHVPRARSHHRAWS
jgi:hypothetical protein